MRKLEEIRKDIAEVAGRLQQAEAAYTDIITNYTNRVPEKYRKNIVDLKNELDKLADEHHAAFHSAR